MKKLLTKVIVLVLGATSFISCGSRASAIAVTSYPVQYLFERIGNNSLTVHNISQGSYYQRMTIKDNTKTILKQSESLFYIRGFEPYIDDLGAELSSVNVKLVNLANANSVYNFNRYTKEIKEDGSIKFVETPYYEGEIFNGIDTYAKDPMLWMDPITMSAMGASVKDYLVQRHPENSEVYEENFATLELELAQLDAKYQSFLRNDKTIKFAVMAPNYGNWQKTYGIEVYPVSLSESGQLPTLDQFEAIKARLIQDGVIYMAVEEGLPEDVQLMQEQLINELGLTPISLNSFAAMGDSDYETELDYMGIMYQNYNILETIAY